MNRSMFLEADGWEAYWRLGVAASSPVRVLSTRHNNRAVSKRMTLENADTPIRRHASPHPSGRTLFRSDWTKLQQGNFENLKP
jgi:hypothetical protein